MSQPIKAPVLPKAEPKVEAPKAPPKAQPKDFMKELDARIERSKELYLKDNFNKGHLENLKLQLEVKNLLGGK